MTASGIFCDAVSLEIPLLMLNSPYLEFYSRYGIGIIKNSIDSMAKELSRLYLQKKAEEYKEADRRLKKQSFKVLQG